LRRAAPRSADDLAPLGQAGPLPDEIRPRVHELNGLFLARQQDGAGPALQPLVLTNVLRLALADVAPEAQQRGIDLALCSADAEAATPEAAAEAATATGDADALRVPLRNLRAPAVKYTPAGGRVDVTLQCPSGALCLRVEDSGPGTAEARRERFVDRFYRTPGVAASAGGVGLGLAIVKAIADSHGARLAIGHSERLGGLSVELRLPAAPD